MKYLSFEYQKGEVNKYCDTKWCYTTCKIREKCFRKNKSKVVSGFLYLVLEELKGGE